MNISIVKYVVGATEAPPVTTAAARHIVPLTVYDGQVIVEIGGSKSGKGNHRKDQMPYS